MNLQIKKLILLSCSAFILTAFSPDKPEKAPPPLPHDVASAVPLERKVAPLTPQQNNNGDQLTPHQKEELKINEDTVMNPFPG